MSPSSIPSMKLVIWLFLLASQRSVARLTGKRNELVSPDGQSDDAEGSKSVQEALHRVEAVENVRTSRVLCRLAGSDGDNAVTVRLQPSDNARSLVFNDDTTGFETLVHCGGQPDAGCLAKAEDAPEVAHSIDECPICSCSQASGQLFGKYAIKMAAEVDGKCHAGGQSGEAFRVLLLGLAGGEIATHIVKNCDRAQLDAVELDGRLPALAQKYFGLPDAVHVTVGDAGPATTAFRRAIEQDALLSHEKSYDVVLVDCFASGGITPEHCRSKEFVDDVVHVLKGGGMVLHHLWHTDDRHPEVSQEFTATVQLYEDFCKSNKCHVRVQALEGPDSMVVVETPRAASEDI